MLEKRIEQARRLAEELLGPIDDVVHQPYGHAGATFEILARLGSFILKTSDRLGAFDYTERHLAVLSSLEISTQTILKRGCHAGFEYLLLTKIPGRDLGTVLGEMTREQMARLACEVVDIERKVGSLPIGKGFGWTPMEVPGPFLNWTAVIVRDSQSSPAEVREEISQWQGYLDRVEPICFLDDLTVKNVIVQDGVLQGIVDLDEVCYGDPLYWLSLTEVTAILDVGIYGAYYGEELRRQWGLTEEESAACDLYNVIQAWFFLSKGTQNAPLELWTTERFKRAQAFWPQPLG